mgnify:FL=1
MKFILTFIFCSGVAGKCLQPAEYPERYADLYTCLHAGYKESIVQLEAVGKESVNKEQIFIKFLCAPMQET